MVIPYLKGGDIVWNYVEDNISGEKEDYKGIGLCGLNYKLFEEEEGGCV